MIQDDSRPYQSFQEVTRILARASRSFASEIQRVRFFAVSLAVNGTHETALLLWLFLDFLTRFSVFFVFPANFSVLETFLCNFLLEKGKPFCLKLLETLLALLIRILQRRNNGFRNTQVLAGVL